MRLFLRMLANANDASWERLRAALRDHPVLQAWHLFLWACLAFD